MKSKPLKCTYVFLAILLLISGHAWAIDQGSVRIRVANTEGGVIPEVQIVCKDPGGNMVHQTRTSKAGEAIINNLLEGTYTIFLEKQGYDSRSKKISIMAKAELYDSIIMRGGRLESKKGIFPMKVRLGPPHDTNVFAIKVKGPLEDEKSKHGEIQFGKVTVSIDGKLSYSQLLSALDAMEQSSHSLQSLKQSIWLQIEGNVSCFQLLSVLEVFYEFQKTEQVYLSIASPEVWTLPIQTMQSSMTGLNIMVGDSIAHSQGSRRAYPIVEIVGTTPAKQNTDADELTQSVDMQPSMFVVNATVEIIGPTPAKQNTDTYGAARFVDIQPGMYTVKVTKDGYQSQEVQITVQPEITEFLRIHLVSTGVSPVFTDPWLPSDGLQLKLPVATNMKIPDRQHSILLLDRSKVPGFHSGSVYQIITSVEQMQLVFRQARAPSLLIAADVDTDSRWIVGMLKHASASKFTECHFIVQ